MLVLLAKGIGMTDESNKEAPEEVGELVIARAGERAAGIIAGAREGLLGAGCWFTLASLASIPKLLDIDSACRSRDFNFEGGEISSLGCK